MKATEERGVYGRSDEVSDAPEERAEDILDYARSARRASDLADRARRAGHR